MAPFGRPIYKVSVCRYIYGMDWKTIITDIKKGLGLTQAQIAAKVGAAQVSIHELESGKTKEPRYCTGNALVALHKKATKRLRSNAPVQAAPELTTD